mgnify:CR=1 FL=1
MIPRTMKAVLLRNHGGYEQLDFRDDVPVPVPAVFTGGTSWSPLSVTFTSSPIATLE